MAHYKLQRTRGEKRKREEANWKHQRWASLGWKFCQRASLSLFISTGYSKPGAWTPGKGWSFCHQRWWLGRLLVPCSGILVKRAKEPFTVLARAWRGQWTFVYEKVKFVWRRGSTRTFLCRLQAELQTVVTEQHAANCPVREITLITLASGMMNAGKPEAGHVLLSRTFDQTGFGLPFPSLICLLFCFVLVSMFILCELSPRGYG